MEPPEMGVVLDTIVQSIFLCVVAPNFSNFVDFFDNRKFHVWSPNPLECGPTSLVVGRPWI
jgi:hypothetical protein